MKANKALKRLAKIEASMSDVAKRFAASAPHIGDVLRDLKAAIARVKETVEAAASSSRAKVKAKKKTAPSKKKAAAKKAAVKIPAAKTQKKSAPVKKAPRKKPAVKKAAPASAPAATAPQDLMAGAADLNS